MIMIIGGMDQSHCCVPYLGGQDSFGAPLTQHDVGLIMYRTVEIVSGKSQGSTIYCASSPVSGCVADARLLPAARAGDVALPALAAAYCRTSADPSAANCLSTNWCSGATTE